MKPRIRIKSNNDGTYFYQLIVDDFIGMPFRDLTKFLINWYN